MSRVAILNGT